MTTLTQASIVSRKTFITIIIGLVIAVFSFLLFKIGQNITKAIFPPPQQPAAVAFFKLPKIDLSSGIKPSQSIQYKLDTVTAELPELQNQTKVFKITKKEPTFGDLERTKTLAARAAFDKEPLQITGTVAKFTSQSSKQKILTIDTTSGDFTLESNYLTSDFIITHRPFSIEQAIEKAKIFFKYFELSKEDFPQDKVSTITFKIENGKLERTPALAGSNLVQVSFGRNDIAGLPVLYLREEAANIFALVSIDQIVAANLYTPRVQKNQFSTYPLKSVKTAFEELKAGNGYFNKPLDGDTFSVRQIYLAYMETEKHQPFLQPVYVFQSNDNLLAFISAIDDNWVED